MNDIIKQGEEELESSKKDNIELDFLWPNVIVSVNKINLQKLTDINPENQTIKKFNDTKGTVFVTGNRANANKFMSFYKKWVEALWLEICSGTLLL